MLTQLGSTLWSSASKVKRLAGKVGIFQPLRVDARVVSVGNIQAGGAGKTPLVAMLVRDALQRGLQVWILTRGYRGGREKAGGVVSPDIGVVSAPEWGDEAALLHDLCPAAWIGVGQNRVEQYHQLIKRLGRPPDLVVLDDGFQNHQFVKDVEIVALTSAQPDQVFFRDSWAALEEADLLIWTKGEVSPRFRDWQSRKPWAEVQFELPRAASKMPIWLISGIAFSQMAIQSAERAGYSIMRTTSLADHFAYDANTVQSYFAQAESLGAQIALTGKDWVKWRSLGFSSDRVLILEPEIRWIHGRETWERVVWATSV